MSSKLVKKQRVLRGPNLHGRFNRRNLITEPWTVTYVNNRLDGFQITETEGHPFRHRFKMREGDVGGPFRTLKNECFVDTHSQHVQDKLGRFSVWDGTFSVPYPNATLPGWTDFPIATLSPSSDLDTLGAVAVNLANPINPVGDAGLILAESVREGLPSLPGIRLWKNRTKAILGAADEFLNAEFGWLPLLNDIKETSKAIKQATQILEQYKRDEGKLVRRDWYFPTEKTESSERLVDNLLPIFGGTATPTDGELIGGWPEGSVVRVKQSERKLWFKGAFTYTIPDGILNSLYEGGSQADVLLGTTLTPETLWELTPWSWAIDWFSNAQEVISNLQSLKIDGLVMPYGYLMSETIKKTTYMMDFQRNQVANATRRSLSVPSTSFVSRKKERAQANPFGFGLEWSDLSPTQLAILAALGITFAL